MKRKTRLPAGTAPMVAVLAMLCGVPTAMLGNAAVSPSIAGRP